MDDKERFYLNYGVKEARRLLLLLLAVEVVLVAAYVVLHIVLPEVRWGPLSLLFDLDRDLAIPAWFSSIQLFAASAVLFLLSCHEQQYRWFIGLGALAMLFLSVDEGVAYMRKSPSMP